MSSGDDAELDVLARSMTDIDYARRAISIARNHDFDHQSGRSWAWERISTSVSDLGELPGPAEWARWLEHEFDDLEHPRAQTIMAEIVALRRRSKDSSIRPEHALRAIEDFVKTAALVQGIHSAAEELGEKDIEAAQEKMRAALQRADQTRIPEQTSAKRALKDFVRRLKKGEPLGERFVTGIPELDGLVGGGFPRGKLISFCAFTHTGKSAFLTGLAYSTADNTPDAIVVIVTTEETEEERVARLAARLTMVDRADYTDGAATDSEIEGLGLMTEKKASLLDRILVYEVAPKSSVGDVIAIAYDVRANHPDSPVMMVIDSPDHLTPDGRQESHRLGQSDVWWSMLGMVHDRRLKPMSVVVSTQAPGKAENKHSPSLSDVSESLDKSRTADFWAFLISAGDGDDEGGWGDDGYKLVDALVRKNRCGRIKDWRISMRGHFGTCHFEAIEGGREIDCGVDS